MKKLSPEHRLKVIRTLKSGKGVKNGNWKGGRILTKDGYVLLRLPEHPNTRSNGYFPEHRYVMEKSLGRILERDEVVHHLNGVKEDNRILNLVLISHKEHGNIHWNTPEAKVSQSIHMKNARAKRFWSTSKKHYKPNQQPL